MRGRHRPRLAEISARPHPAAPLLVFGLVAAAATARLLQQSQQTWSVYGLAVGILLAAKLSLSLAPLPRWQPAPPETLVLAGRVAA